MNKNQRDNHGHFTKNITPVIPKEKEPNVRQKLVIKGIMEGKTQTQAYQEVYKTSKSVAKTNAPRMLANACVQNALTKALRKKGLDEDWIAGLIKDMGENPDWRAKDTAVLRASNSFGYLLRKESPGTQVNILTQVNKDKDEFGI